MTASGRTTTALQRLAENLTPMGPRSAVLNPAAYHTALRERVFVDASFSAGEGERTAQSGIIGRGLGAMFGMDQNIVRHASGNAGTREVNMSGGLAAGANTAPIDGTGTVNVGDVFSVANDPNTYVATAAVANNGTSLSFAPANRVAWANNATITFQASHAVNLVFHPACFAFATVPLQSEVATLRTVRDTISQLTFTMEWERQNFRDALKISILYGTGLVRPQFGCRLLG